MSPRAEIFTELPEAEMIAGQQRHLFEWPPPHDIVPAKDTVLCGDDTLSEAAAM